MTFQDKERLDIHQKKAHSGRGENINIQETVVCKVNYRHTLIY